MTHRDIGLAEYEFVFHSLRQLWVPRCAYHPGGPQTNFWHVSFLAGAEKRASDSTIASLDYL